MTLYSRKFSTFNPFNAIVLMFKAKSYVDNHKEIY